MTPCRREALATIALVASLAAVAAGAQLALTDRFRDRGDLEHVAMAWNLWRYGVVSRFDDTGTPPKPTWRREPLYPALLAGVLALRAHPERDDLACLTSGDERCRPLRRALKQVNVALLVALAGATWWAARELIGAHALTWLAYGLVALNGVFWTLLDDFRSETAAALALLVASLCLRRVALGSRRAADLLGAGASLGALMLVKAIFFYVGPALFALALWLGLRPAGRARARRLAAALCLAYAVAGVWMARNALHGGGFRIAEDRGVLAIRAEYDTMTWREWRAAWLYYARSLRPARWALERFFQPSDWERLERANPDGFYRRAKRDAGAAAALLGFPDHPPKPAELQQAARIVILEHLPMHVAATGPLALQSCFVYERYFRLRPLATLLEGSSCLLIPALLFVTLRLLVRRDPGRAVFYVPAVACFALHAAATHDIPRYSWPLIPVATLALVGLLDGPAPPVPSAAEGRVAQPV